jgi:hypothetical protein
MSDEFSVVEKVLKEVLIDLMEERVMSIGVQASSTRGVQASSSTARGSRPSRVEDEKRTKHRDDLANAKLIPSVLPNYIPPLASCSESSECLEGLRLHIHHDVPPEGDMRSQTAVGEDSNIEYQ